MASGPKTEYLISSYKKSITQDNKQKEQLDQVLAGIEIRTSDDSDPDYVIEGINDQINRFDPATKGLDKRILEINNQIKTIQSQMSFAKESVN